MCSKHLAHEKHNVFEAFVSFGCTRVAVNPSARNGQRLHHYTSPVESFSAARAMKYPYHAPHGAARALDLGSRSFPRDVVRYSWSAALVAPADELHQSVEFSVSQSQNYLIAATYSESLTLRP